MIQLYGRLNKPLRYVLLVVQIICLIAIFLHAMIINMTRQNEQYGVLLLIYAALFIGLLFAVAIQIYLIYLEEKEKEKK